MSLVVRISVGYKDVVVAACKRVSPITDSHIHPDTSCSYITDDGHMIFHKYGDGAIELARKLLKTIERKESEMGEETVTVEQVRIKRLVNTVYKIAGWNGTDISELIEEGLLEENDLDL